MRDTVPVTRYQLTDCHEAFIRMSWRYAPTKSSCKNFKCFNGLFSRIIKVKNNNNLCESVDLARWDCDFSVNNIQNYYIKSATIIINYFDYILKIIWKMLWMYSFLFKFILWGKLTNIPICETYSLAQIHPWSLTDLLAKKVGWSDTHLLEFKLKYYSNRLVYIDRLSSSISREFGKFPLPSYFGGKSLWSQEVRLPFIPINLSTLVLLWCKCVAFHWWPWTGDGVVGRPLLSQYYCPHLKIWSLNVV